MSTLLKRLPLFAGLTPEQTQVISAGSHLAWLDRGEVLFHQGDPVRGFFFVLRGQVQLTVSTTAGAEKVVEIIPAGESFGEAVVFDGLRYPVTATALIATDLLAVSSAAVLDLLDRDPTFGRRMLANMAARLRRLVRDVESYSLRTGVQRVIAFLLSEAELGPRPGALPVSGTKAAGTGALPVSGTKAAGTGAQQSEGEGDAAANRCGPEAMCPCGLGPCRTSIVLLPTSKHVLASRLNLKPETFSRVLRDLSADGLISVEGRRIILHDRCKLESCSNGREPCHIMSVNEPELIWVKELRTRLP